MNNRIKNMFSLFNKKLLGYVLTNRLFISYVIFSIIITSLSRYLTLGEIFFYRSFLADLGIILVIGGLGYFVKAKGQFRYFFIWMGIYTFAAVINTIYYKFYASFASVGEFATLGQTETVMDSIFEKVLIWDFSYIIFLVLFYYVHKKLLKSSYYYYASLIEKNKKMVASTILTGLTLVLIVVFTSNAIDFSRLTKQWNRVSNVDRFGILFYQGNDIVQTLTPRISSLFGYEEAAIKFNEYFSSTEDAKSNKYTEILKGNNIVFIHMESIQNFLMDLEFNGKEVLPNTNRLAKEGMFFTNFHPQISSGTSSDTEFTLLTSLMPALSGTVFVSYYNREYITLPNILKAEGYHSFSMHGNNFSMWNRNKAHPALGYEDFYFEDAFEFGEEDVINLGINDLLFFKQGFSYLEEIELKYPNYFGTIITLTNHSKFPDVSEFIDIDLSFEIDKEVLDPLSEKAIGRYIKSSHYADYALGEFFELINSSNEFNNTLFVLYGDHDAKFSKGAINYLYNYDALTDTVKTELDEGYVMYDNYSHEINKKTPLILWTKNKNLRKTLKGEVDYPMGAIDVLPTLLNMLGLNNKYALGSDIFNAKEDNYVVFPNGNFLTDKIYYNASIGEYKTLKENVILDSDYIENINKLVEDKLQISNSIIVYDLIKKEVHKR